MHTVFDAEGSPLTLSVRGRRIILDDEVDQLTVKPHPLGKLLEALSKPKNLSVKLLVTHGDRDVDGHLDIETTDAGKLLRFYDHEELRSQVVVKTGDVNNFIADLKIGAEHAHQTWQQHQSGKVLE